MGCGGSKEDTSGRERNDAIEAQLKRDKMNLRNEIKMCVSRVFSLLSPWLSLRQHCEWAGRGTDALLTCGRGERARPLFSLERLLTMFVYTTAAGCSSVQESRASPPCSSR